MSSCWGRSCCAGAGAKASSKPRWIFHPLRCILSTMMMAVKVAAVLFRAVVTAAPLKLEDVAPVWEAHPRRFLLPLQSRFQLLQLERYKELGQGSRARDMLMAPRPRITTLCVNSRGRNRNRSNNHNRKYAGNNSRTSGLYRQTSRRPTPSAIHPRSYPRTTGISPHSTFPSQRRRRLRQ